MKHRTIAEEIEAENKYEKAFKKSMANNKKIMIEFKTTLYERALSMAQKEISMPSTQRTSIHKIYQDISKYKIALANLREGIIC